MHASQLSIFGTIFCHALVYTGIFPSFKIYHAVLCYSFYRLQPEIIELIVFQGYSILNDLQSLFFTHLGIPVDILVIVVMVKSVSDVKSEKDQGHG